MELLVLSTQQNGVTMTPIIEEMHANVHPQLCDGIGTHSFRNSITNRLWVL